MDFKTKITQNLRSSTSDKEALNRQILKWHKSLKEVEKIADKCDTSFNNVVISMIEACIYGNGEGQEEKKTIKS